LQEKKFAEVYAQILDDSFDEQAAQRYFRETSEGYSLISFKVYEKRYWLLRNPERETGSNISELTQSRWMEASFQTNYKLAIF